MKIYKKTTIILQSILCLIFKPLLGYFINMKVRGLENLKDYKEPYIIVSNHSSELDILVILTVIFRQLKNKPLFCVVREKKFYSDMAGLRKFFYGGFIFKLFGGYEVYRGTGNYQKSLINHIAIVKKGYSTCFFIEGKTSKDGNLNRAKGGALFLSKETSLPIVPISINGLYNINFKDFILRKRTGRVTVCKPITSHDLDLVYQPENIYYYGEQSQFIMQIIKKSLW